MSTASHNRPSSMRTRLQCEQIGIIPRSVCSSHFAWSASIADSHSAFRARITSLHSSKRRKLETYPSAIAAAKKMAKRSLSPSSSPVPGRIHSMNAAPALRIVTGIVCSDGRLGNATNMVFTNTRSNAMLGMSFEGRSAWIKSSRITTAIDPPNEIASRRR